MTTVNNSGYQPAAADTLFKNLNGVRGRLPQQLVDKLREVCQKNGFEGNLDSDMRENWFDIYSKIDGQRNIVRVSDAKYGPIGVRGNLGSSVSIDVMTLLEEVSSQLAQQ